MTITKKQKWAKIEPALNKSIDRLESYISNGYAGNNFGEASEVLDGLKKTKVKFEGNEPANAAEEIAKVFYFGNINADKWTTILKINMALLTCRLMDMDNKGYRGMEPDWENPNE